MIGAMRWVAVLVAAVALQVPVKVDPDFGVSESLARERAARISNVRYDLAFTVPAARSEPVTAREVVRFVLADRSEPLVLDFAPNRSGFLKKVEVNGAETQVRQVNGHLIVPAASLRAAENAISLEFNAGDA